VLVYGSSLAVPDRNEVIGDGAEPAYLIGSSSRSLHKFFKRLCFGWGGTTT
jgi:hypothetical protein